jgi:hypothetical protein
VPSADAAGRALAWGNLSVLKQVAKRLNEI